MLLKTVYIVPGTIPAVKNRSSVENLVLRSYFVPNPGGNFNESILRGINQLSVLINSFP